MASLAADPCFEKPAWLALPAGIYGFLESGAGEAVAGGTPGDLQR